MYRIFVEISGFVFPARKYIDHGVGESALRKYAHSEFEHECVDAQMSAANNRENITVRLVNMKTNKIEKSKTLRPAIVNIDITH